MLKYSKEVENLPEFDIVSKEYNDWVKEYLPEIKNDISNGKYSKEQGLIKLGEKTWEQISEKYNVKLYFEKRKL